MTDIEILMLAEQFPTLKHGSTDDKLGFARQIEQASRRAALEEGYALGFEASGEGWNGEYPNRDLTADPQWIAQRDKDLSGPTET